MPRREAVVPAPVYLRVRDLFVKFGVRADRSGDQGGLFFKSINDE